MNLRDYFIKYGIMIKHFAKTAGTTPATIYNAIRGKDISLMTALKIEEASDFRVSCRELVGDNWKEKSKRGPKKLGEKNVSLNGDKKEKDGKSQ